MSFGTDLAVDFNNLVKNRGQIIRIKYYTEAIAGAGSSFDDDVALTQSGTDLWISGIPLPIKRTADPIVDDAGRTLRDEQVLYINGSIGTSGAFKVGLGSPVANEYAVGSPGVILWNMQDVPVYKKVHIHALTNGSLFGE